MIEYSISYYDNGSHVVIAKFDNNAVEVVFKRTTILNAREWDNRSLFLRNQTHSQWPMRYAGTPLAAELQMLTTQAIMAFGALHVVAPEYRIVQHFEANPHLISQLHFNHLAKSSPGFINHIIPASNTSAEQELFYKGLFQHLEITVQNFSLNRTFGFYFVPFNVPSIAPSNLSADAQLLRNSLP